MLTAILCLIGCQLIGETVREVFHLPIPGPVIGMFLLAAMLALRGGKADRAILGIIAEAGLLRQQWLSIVAALLGSTVLSIAVTGLAMYWVTRWSEASGKTSVSLVELSRGRS